MIDDNRGGLFIPGQEKPFKVALYPLPVSGGSSFIVNTRDGPVCVVAGGIPIVLDIASRLSAAMAPQTPDSIPSGDPKAIAQRSLCLAESLVEEYNVLMAERAVKSGKDANGATE